MKRFMIMTALLAALLLSLSACAGNMESGNNQNPDPDTTNQGKFEEKKDVITGF